MAKAKKDTKKEEAAPAERSAVKPSTAPAKKAPAAAAAAPAASAKAPAASAKSPAGKKPAAKADKPAAAPTSRPLIDTDLAASAAASMIANRGSRGAGTPATGGQPKESSAFRQLKDSVANPGAQNLGGILGTGPMMQKKSQSHGPDRQVARNQTFGADVSRASVPRRTSGG